LPVVEIPRLDFSFDGNPGMPAYLLLVRAGLAASNGEARRLIRGGGARLDNVVIADEAQLVAPKPEQKLSAGKKQHVLVRLGA